MLYCLFCVISDYLQVCSMVCVSYNGTAACDVSAVDRTVTTLASVLVSPSPQYRGWPGLSWAGLAGLQRRETNLEPGSVGSPSIKTQSAPLLKHWSRSRCRRPPPLVRAGSVLRCDWSRAVVTSGSWRQRDWAARRLVVVPPGPSLVKCSLVPTDRERGEES